MVNKEKKPIKCRILKLFRHNNQVLEKPPKPEPQRLLIEPPDPPHLKNKEKRLDVAPKPPKNKTNFIKKMTQIMVRKKQEENITPPPLYQIENIDEIIDIISDLEHGIVERKKGNKEYMGPKDRTIPLKSVKHEIKNEIKPPTKHEIKPIVKREIVLPDPHVSLQENHKLEILHKIKEIEKQIRLKQNQLHNKKSNKRQEILDKIDEVKEQIRQKQNQQNIEAKKKQIQEQIKLITQQIHNRENKKIKRKIQKGEDKEIKRKQIKLQIKEIKRALYMRKKMKTPKFSGTRFRLK